MGKLIDADKFKKQIVGMTILNNYSPSKANALCELIDQQLEAYDPDKVIEQLESNITKPMNGAKDIGSAYWNAGIEKAIKIVKGGGINAET